MTLTATPISAAQVKELRDRTGAGIGDCKKALEFTGGDIDAAAEKLRIDGMAKADKKGSRTAAEGMVAVAVADDAIAIVEVNCETDFVTKGADFQELANTAARLALAHRPASVEALLASAEGGQTLEDKRKALVARIGENMTVRRVDIVMKDAGAIAYYLHGARIGVVVALTAGDAALAKDIAMHIAASSPRYLSAETVPAEVIEAERKIIEAQSAEASAGKTPEIAAKMIDGKVRKFLAEISLLGQPFVKDPDLTVEKLLKAKSAGVKQFVRYAVGEGIEKKQVDFAAEVMAQLKS